MLKGKLSERIVTYQMNIQSTIKDYFQNKIHLTEDEIVDFLKWTFVVDGFLENIV
jgi:hypothetical protein